MISFKNSLKAFNEFNSSSHFEQERFGSLLFRNYSVSHPFNSKILTRVQNYDLIDLCEFDLSEKWSLLFRGSRDGFSANDFHSKCDGHSNTLTILKAKQTSYIFGAFTTVDWESSSWPGKYKSDPNAFIFSLTNKENKPMKMRPNKYENAVYTYAQYGPTFGRGYDIFIANDANTTTDSYSNFGYSYTHPQYEYGTNAAQTLLAGSMYFQLDEIEVYQREQV